MFTQAVDDQHAVPSAEGDGPDPRVPVPGGSGRGQRRVPARAARPGIPSPRAPPSPIPAGSRPAFNRAGGPAEPAGEQRRTIRRDGRTASRIFRAPTCRMAAAPTTAWSAQPASAFTPGGRGIVVDPPDGKLPMQAWAKAEAREPEASRARLRRSDGALFRRRRAAVDVRPVAVPHPADAGLRRDAVRAHVVAHRARSTDARTSRTTSVSGRAIRWATGTAIHSSSKPPT